MSQQILVDLTGVKPEAAAALLSVFSDSVEVCLAYVVQMRGELSEAKLFADEEMSTLKKNSETIDAILRGTYDCVQSLVDAGRSSTHSWMAFARWSVTSNDAPSKQTTAQKNFGAEWTTERCVKMFHSFSRANAAPVLTAPPSVGESLGKAAPIEAPRPDREGLCTAEAGETAGRSFQQPAKALVTSGSKDVKPTPSAGREPESQSGLKAKSDGAAVPTSSAQPAQSPLPSDKPAAFLTTVRAQEKSASASTDTTKTNPFAAAAKVQPFQSAFGTSQPAPASGSQGTSGAKAGGASWPAATAQPAKSPVASGSAFSGVRPEAAFTSAFGVKTGAAAEPAKSTAPAPTSVAPSDATKPAPTPFAAAAKVSPFQSALGTSQPAASGFQSAFGKKAEGGMPQTTNDAASSVPAFSFGATSRPSDAAVPAPKGFAEARAATMVTREEPKYLDEPPHDTRCFLDLPGFVESEIQTRAPLFLKDPNGYVLKNVESIRQLTKQWFDSVGDFYSGQPVRYVAITNPDEQLVRVIIKDAERTFFEKAHRDKLTSFLVAMSTELRSYGQAMSYFAAVCLLTLSENETAAIVRKVAKEYIPGHWAAEAVGFATNAWVVERVLQMTHPDVAAHLSQLSIWPDTYMQKILSGLCIHVLPFPLMYEFLTQFVCGGGFMFLVRFMISFLSTLSRDILRLSELQVGQVYELLKLDEGAVEVGEMRRILQRACREGLLPESCTAPGWVEAVRMEVYDERIAPRIARAGKIDEFEPCVVCEVARPAWYHDDWGAVCSSCKEKKGGVKGWEKY